MSLGGGPAQNIVTIHHPMLDCSQIGQDYDEHVLKGSV